MDLHPTFLVLIAVAPTVAVLAVSFVQFLGRRTVDREDKDKENIQKRVDALGTRLTSIDHQLISIQSDMKQNFAQLENVRGGVTELRVGMDGRFEKQAAFYRAEVKEGMELMTEKLEKLEFSVRQDMSRAMADFMRAKRKP